ncbi:MAG TPA: S41 family peptidase [Anaeromyxobacter sp.]
MRRSLALLVLPLVLAGCPAPQPDSCTPQAQKADVLGLMQSWYLYPDLLRSISPNDPAYPTVDAYLWALTADARAAGKDRGWTYATTYSASQRYYADGTAVGFGIGILVRQDASNAYHVLVSQVFPGSPASSASFARGDEILAIGDTPATLVDVPTLVAGAATIDDARAAVSSAIGPSTAGLSRSFQVLPLGASTSVLRTMTKDGYLLDPVPAGWTVFDPAGPTPIGYVALRTFIGTAQIPLQNVFAQFQQQNVHDVIVDLRYNGGGLISIAELLADLLGGARSTSDVMYHVSFNAQHASSAETVFFAPQAQSTQAMRVAFITTGATASASELVANVLEPYLTGNIALVGARTYGKPVGQAGFAFYQCDLAVYLIALSLTNADGEGGYFDGLPDASGNFSGPLCAAPDDLTHLQSDPAEASTAAAIAWMTTGTCPAPAVAAKASGPSVLKAAAPVPDAYPDAIAPDEAQRNVRGLF